MEFDILAEISVAPEVSLLYVRPSDHAPLIPRYAQSGAAPIYDLCDLSDSAVPLKLKGEIEMCDLACAPLGNTWMGHKVGVGI